MATWLHLGHALQVLKESSTRPSSLSSLAFGTCPSSVKENRLLCHLCSAVTVYGFSSLVNLPNCSKGKAISWCFCSSCVNRSPVCFSLPPLLKLDPLTVSVLTILLQFTTTGVVPPFGVLWFEFHHLLCIVGRSNSSALGFYLVLQLYDARVLCCR